jgi:hypothetical protein
MTRETSGNGTSNPGKPIRYHLCIFYIASDLLIFILKIVGWGFLEPVREYKLYYSEEKFD